MNSRHAIRERPHVCTTLSVASDVKEEEVGGGGEAVCGCYKNCSVLKQRDCNNRTVPQSHTISHTDIRSLFLFFSQLHIHRHTKCHIDLKHLEPYT